MDTALIERLAGLRGIADAYHDYRGELKSFTLQTKTGILRAMGCAVDDENELAASLVHAEAVRWRKLLPPVATSRGARIAFDINVSARELGDSLVWRVHWENGSRSNGVTATADCAEVWRGEVAGSWITRRRFELMIDLAPGYHEFEDSARRRRRKGWPRTRDSRAADLRLIRSAGA